MDRRQQTLIGLGSLAALTGVIAGAFGAHGVADPLSKELLRTGAEYQMIHGLAVFGAVLWARAGGRWAAAAAWLFLAGCVMFSGSLYVLALGGQRWAGPITPLGGLCFILGWGLLAFGAFTAKASDTA